MDHIFTITDYSPLTIIHQWMDYLKSKHICFRKAANTEQPILQPQKEFEWKRKKAENERLQTKLTEENVAESQQNIHCELRKVNTVPRNYD